MAYGQSMLCKRIYCGSGCCVLQIQKFEGTLGTCIHSPGYENYFSYFSIKKHTLWYSLEAPQ